MDSPIPILDPIQIKQKPYLYKGKNAENQIFQ